MKMPTWMKPAVWGVVSGAAAASILGFTVGGWTTESTATMLANKAVDHAVQEALVPFCVAKAHKDPEYQTKLALISEASNWNRDKVLIETGWANFLEGVEPDDDIADACAKAILSAKA